MYFCATILHFEGTICFNMNSSRNCNAAKETFISCVEAPNLKGVSTQHFIEFNRRRDLYEKQLKEKDVYFGERRDATSYKASIENEDLKVFFAAGWIEGFLIIELTESQIKICIKQKCKRKLTG